MTITKTCSGCLSKKLRSKFYKRSSKPDGLDYYCKQCRNGYSMRNVKENPMTCSEPHCTKPHYARKMCRNCYARDAYATKTRQAGRER